MLFECRHTGAAVDAAGEQMVAVGLGAAVRAADANEVDAVVQELAADFVDGAVGVRQQQDGSARFKELFLHGIEHAEGGLARAGRANDEEQVARLFHPQGQVVEVAIVALQCPCSVYLGLAL